MGIDVNHLQTLCLEKINLREKKQAKNLLSNLCSFMLECLFDLILLQLWVEDV